MKHKPTTLLLYICCLPALPLLGQTQIGGGTCNSSSLNGAYAVTLSGRQINSSGNFASVIQANGSASFDGQSKVTITISADSLSSVGTAVTWSGTYTIQANCTGSLTIMTGGSPSFNLVVYNRGNDFLVAGTDATYSYSGSGNIQPGTCSVNSFSGVYVVTGTGYALSGSAVAGVGNGTGLLQFDGQGHLTANVTVTASGAAPNALSLSGSYTVSSNCTASAALSDSKSNAYVMTFSVYSGNATSSADFYLTLAQASKLLVSGSAHAAYGQPTAMIVNSRYSNSHGEGA